MNWYKRITNKCRGNGQWGPCLNEVHARRDLIRKQAQELCEKNGHTMSPFNVMNQAFCLKCGQYVNCNNIFAPTAADDQTGAALINKCAVHLEGGYRHYRDKYPESPAATKTVL